MLAPSINRRLIYVCLRLYAVRGRPSRSKLRFSSSRIVLKSSRCHFGKMRSVGSGRRNFSDPFVVDFAPFPSLGCAVCAYRTESGLQSLERAHGAAHALAVADTALAAHLDLKDRFGRSGLLQRFSRPGIEGAKLHQDEGWCWPRTERSREVVLIPICSAPSSARARAFLSLRRASPYSSGENQARCEIFADDLYGSERSGRWSSHPWRMAVFNVCRRVTIS